MRFVWVDAANDAAWNPILDSFSMTGAFFAGTDPAPDLRRRLTDCKDRGRQGGIYTAWNWWPDSDGDTPEHGRRYAERTVEIVRNARRGLAGASNAFPKVQLDNEEHSPETILAMLRRFRELMPSQDCSWTFESMQGGWMSPAFVGEVISLRVRLVPQAYTGRMADLGQPAETQLTEFRDSLIAQDIVLRDLTKRGFPESIISLFYDAAFLPPYWDGFAFTQGRLRR